jgi:NADPH oxidase
MIHTALEADARTPFTPVADKTLPYGRQLITLASICAFSVLVSALGLAQFYTSDFVKGVHDKNNARGYTALNLFSFYFWIVAGPVAIASVMKSTLLAYKMPMNSRLSRIFIAAVLGISGLGVAALGAFGLGASEMLECGYLWCYAMDATTSENAGLKQAAGVQIFIFGLIVFGLAAVLVRRALSSDGVEKASTEQMVAYMKRAKHIKDLKQHVAAAALLVGLPLLLFVIGLLPNAWESFSRSALKTFVSSVINPEYSNAFMKTWNWRLTEDVVVKFFPDTVLFYAFLEGVVLVAFAQTKSKLIRQFLSKKLRGVTIGRALLLAWFTLYLFLFTAYWAHDHLWEGYGKYTYKNTTFEVLARVSGIVAQMSLGLLLLPASKSSPVLAVAGVSWESALWVHINLAILFLATASLHVLFYAVNFISKGNVLDLLPLNWLFYYPQNGPGIPSDNWTVPLMSGVFWPTLVIFGILPWKRRANYELFRYSHNYFMILIPVVFWHATHSWYFLFPGLSLWILDRILRFMSSTEHVSVQCYEPHSVDCWTDARPGRPSQNMPERITKMGFTWPGQTRVHSPGMYVLVNFPQVSLGEWHPFSLSSSPLDTVASVHMKNMGDNTFTGKLHKFVSDAPSRDTILMNVQGPYGPKVDLFRSAHVVLVSGGIGVTPMVNSLRCAVQHAQAGGDCGALKRLHFIWSARSADVFLILQDELTVSTAGLPFELKISLYCSTIQEDQSCAIGPIIKGMPNFAEILPAEVALGPCFVRACGPPPMVNACANVAKTLEDSVDFEPWSFVM